MKNLDDIHEELEKIRIGVYIFGVLICLIAFFGLGGCEIKLVEAGTTFTQLSKSVEIVDMDKWVKAKVEAEEYERKVKGAMVQCSSSTTITRWHP